MNETVFYVGSAVLATLILYDLIYNDPRRRKIVIENELPKTIATEEQRLEELAKTRGWDDKDSLPALQKRLLALERRFTGLEQRLYTIERLIQDRAAIPPDDPHWDPTR